MDNTEIRAALDRHWTASDANDFEAEHAIWSMMTGGGIAGGLYHALKSMS